MTASAVSDYCLSCESLARRVKLYGDGPVFLVSYEASPEGGQLPRELSNVAFSYDNALAIIALVACGKVETAKQIGEAFHIALAKDRFYKDGRLRNAYAAGRLDPSAEAVALPGYWDDGAGKWIEDGYQVGTATGSAAWVALSLLTLSQADGDARYLEDARKVMRWINVLTIDHGGAGGFRGGFYGHEPSPVRIGWKSTEHNIDIYAVAVFLDTIDKENGWGAAARHALSFLDRAWNPDEKRFHVGTLPDGAALNTDQDGLDTQLWALLGVGDFAERAEDVLAWTYRNHGVDGGFDFNTDRDGLWIEGTAQALLLLKYLNREKEAAIVEEALARNGVGDGYYFASSTQDLTTGLSAGADGSSGEFLYHRLPHLGATSWVVLAGLGWNPFILKYFEQKESGPCLRKY
ncbi:hypothetical protein [Roseibium marinum]|uniref:Methylaspartate ammonia-lyase n=1 Tax=Roseibium marinum TaxID=281252 RepID=A0A2S3URW5_9HYPH|nr:hypothetical protein [Roseibium marinum]POF30465.1 hypothetical protein CLV41_10679 [Roseibium marinum]